ncbi:MFS transporter [Komagataeibacter rhaeticus]|uniref:Sugar porter family MFS transporter n=1 Tax=Komagataeibacter rhaeticus TaxID=215221 RepID=A0A181CA72_9PROT|nr:sugar porter family MFS transporter [Komagataeibacter rhaeticus]ATU72983.1 MFS transporter [Komagataeibacter xylinus]EGG77227.1 D-xylose-proton symporter [Gluconacetobacter sp. SXCC-1]KDU96268.1 D-xylose-proton symporter [Komagataeibacter rhaeticus AF1]MBL7238927.1 sugar porter family MFS transporter [Komagataeibacter rhaeticus]PYD53234.1 MFS transporter [Komagataeibacter rhaeticus]
MVKESLKDIVFVRSDRHDIGYVLRICAIAALGGILFGYDTAVISGAVESLQAYFHLSPVEIGWAVSNVLLGCILGAAGSGWLADRFGRKPTLAVSAALFTGSAIGAALATGFTSFVVYRFIGGVAVGVASSISPMYMSEVSPKDMRGRALYMEQFAIVGGQLLVFIVNYLIARSASEQWLMTVGWRWMLGSEVIPCVIFCIAIFFMPESPRWHVLRGRDHDAMKTLTRISNERHARSVLTEIKDSLEHKVEASALGRAVSSRGARWIIFVGAMVAMLQQLTGVNSMMYYAPLLLGSVSGSVQNALFQTIWIGVASVSGAVLGSWVIDRKGRLPLFRIGSIGMIIGLLIASWALYTQTQGYSALMGMLIYMLLFGLSWGPLTWVLIAEIFPNRIRGVGMSIAVSANWVMNFIVSQLFPMMAQNHRLDALFHGALPMWLFAGFTLLSWWFVERYIPETRGVALEKIESVMLTPKRRRTAAGMAPATPPADGLTDLAGRK